MASFSYTGTLSGAGLSYVSNLTDLEIGWKNGTAFLYTTTGFGGGYSVFSVASNGATALVDQSGYSYSHMASSIRSIELVTINGQTVSVVRVFATNGGLN